MAKWQIFLGLGEPPESQNFIHSSWSLAFFSPWNWLVIKWSRGELFKLTRINISLRFKNRSAIWFKNSISNYIKNWNFGIYPKYWDIYISMFPSKGGSNPKINKRIDRRSMVYTYTRILFNPKKERNSKTC